jgi:hypothetical protein
MAVSSPDAATARCRSRGVNQICEELELDAPASPSKCNRIALAVQSDESQGGDGYHCSSDDRNDQNFQRLLKPLEQRLNDF